MILPHYEMGISPHFGSYHKKLIGSSLYFCQKCVFGQERPHYVLKVIGFSSGLRIQTGFALVEVCTDRLLLSSTSY